MILSNLPKITSRKKKRLGRGYGSTKGGHTSSRGQKGQNSRNSVPMWFEGGQLPQIRRFPFIRGKGRFKSLKPAPVEINLNQLNKFKANSAVNPKSLVDVGLVKSAEIQVRPIRILGRGEIKVPLVIQVDASKQAQQKIEAAGGRIDRGQVS